MSLFDDFLESTESNRTERQNEALIKDDVDIKQQSPTKKMANRRKTGFVAQINNTSDGNNPLFSLQYVQFQLPAKLVSMSVENNILAAVLNNFRILRIDLDNPLEVEVVEISRKPNDNTVTQLFLDPTGRHIIVTTSQGDNYYLFSKWKRTKELVKLKGTTLTCIGWNKNANMNNTTTREILLGTNNGLVYETCLEPTDEFFKREEKYVLLLFSLHELSTAITGIQFERFPSNRRKYIILLSTATRLYQFIGQVKYTRQNIVENGGDKALFELIFKEFEFQELPYLNNTEDNTENRSSSSKLLLMNNEFVWLNPNGIYSGNLNLNEEHKKVVENAKLLQFPATNYNEETKQMEMEIPISIITTEFHFVMLYKNFIRAICKLNDRVIVYEEIIPLNKHEIVQGISIDNSKKTFWIYTNDAIYELIIKNEERDIWKLYLLKKDFQNALKYSKSSIEKQKVYTEQAKNYFDNKNFTESAKYFAKSNLPFEEIVLKFTKLKNQKDALRYFLINRLSRLSPNDRTQRVLISTYIFQLYLTKLNQSQSQQQTTIIKNELHHFLETYGFQNLHLPTIHKLISSYGILQQSNLDDFTFYIGDHEKMIENLIGKQDWIKAIELLDKCKKNDLIYKHSSILIEFAPHDLIQLWINHSTLNPRFLIPSLLKYKNTTQNENQAIRYLSHVVSVFKNTDSIIHNLLLSLYATQPTQDETALLTFLKNEGREMHYKLDYALRLCHQNKRISSCVHIYGQMGLYEAAVNLALQHRDLELAILNADKPEDDDVQRKKLWVSIAKYVIQDNKNIKGAMDFLKKSDLLKMEDILPFFPDFVLIDDFKDEICSALEEYNITIEELKLEMDNATLSADHIRLDVKKLKKRFAIVQEEQMCCLCEYPLLTRQFYVFPCNHEFHADCLINRVTKYLPTRQIRNLADIQEQLSREFKAARTMQPEDEKAITQRIENLRYKLDDIVARQCILCGDVMINSIVFPFISDEELDLAASWDLSRN